MPLPFPLTPHEAAIMPDAGRHPSTPPFRAWRCARGVVLWRGPASHPISESVVKQRASGAPLDEPPGDYWLIDASGRVAEKFESEAWSVEDELGAVLFTVADGSLLRISVSDFLRRPPEIRETVEVAGLSEVARDDAATHGWIFDAVAREQERMARERSAAELAGRERVNAISGALDEYEAGEGFRRAQARLRRQIAAIWAPDSEEALRALVAYGRLHRTVRGPWRATLEWAMEPFVNACRIVGNDLDTVQEPYPVDGPAAPPPAEHLPALRAFSTLLGDFHAQLLRAEEAAFQSDANLTARALRKAADDVVAARARLIRTIGDEPA